MTDLGWNLEYFSDTAGPAAPVALPATSVTADSFRAHWIASTRATRYLLDVARDPLFADLVFRDRLVDGLDELVVGMDEAQTFYYRVRGLNKFGAGAYSNSISLFTDSVDAPVAIAASDIQDSAFRANWLAVVDPDLDHYELDVSESIDFDVLVPIDVVVSTSDLFNTIASLAPETDYYYRVRAVKVNGTTSENSNVISLTTEPLFVGEGGDDVWYFPELNETVHIFDTIGSSTFSVLQGSRAVRRLIVGGGGQGGGVNGSGVACGGGGAGGVLDLDEADRPDELVVDDYEVIVGKGGSVAGALNVGEDGDDSSFDGDVAQGGGHGGSAGSNVGSGGSGGGATNSSGTEFGGLGVAGQGFDGGDANAGSGGGGGGGGADEQGGDGTAVTGGKGGDAVESDITGTLEQYGAGGGGGRPVNAFGVIAATTPGVGGVGGGGSGSNVTPGAGSAATGIGAGGGGSLGNVAGGIGKKGRVAIRYVGRGADAVDFPIDPPDEDPPDMRGPITFAGCTREQTVDAVTILVDCNSKNNTGIFPDYREYRCVGGGVVQSSRWDPAKGATTGNDGILVFRFSEPIRKFTITRRVTADVQAIPTLVACDDYTVIPDPAGSPAGSSEDGSVVHWKTQSPQNVFYPTPHLEPPVDLGAEEDMTIEWADGFSCVVIFQGPDEAPVRTSEFINPMFLLLTD